MPRAPRRIVLTLPLPRARAVAGVLAERGHQPLLLPFTAIEATTSDAAQVARLAALPGFDRVVFVSPASIDVVLGALGGRWPGRAAPAVVGPGSLEALARHGLDAHPGLLVPEGPVFDAAALLQRPELAAPLAQRILVVRAQGGNTRIEEELARRGAQVQVLEAYRRRELAPRAETLATLAGWLAEAAGAAASAGVAEAAHAPCIVVTTVEAAERLAALAQAQESLAWLHECPALTLHPRIAERLGELGWRRVASVAPGLDGLLAAIESAPDSVSCPAINWPEDEP